MIVKIIAIAFHLIYFTVSQPLIWLIGGTQESAVLANTIAAHKLPCVVTVTTEAAKSLYPLASPLQIWVGALTAESLPTFLQDYQITAIVDASHPFAAAISQLAIAASRQFNLPYLRYERPPLSEMWQSSQIEHPVGKVLTLDSFQTLIAGNYLQKQRVLLTVGYRPLAHFQPWQTKATLLARIMPSIMAINAALQAGFSPSRIIAFRPPISAELERALWTQWQLSIVVTKASGVAGGEDIKRTVAAELGITLVTIARPEVIYPQQTSDPNVVLEFCCQQIANNGSFLKF